MNFEHEVIARIGEGKSQLIYNIQLLLFNEYPEYCELIDFENEKIFQEPLLYCFFNFKTRRIEIPQILFGYIEPSLRPRKITVQSDCNGIVYIPGLMYLLTDVRNSQIDLYYSAIDDSVVLKHAGVTISYHAKPIYYLPSTDIEIVQHNNLSFSNFFYKNGNLSDIYIEGTFQRHKNNLQKAFAIIEKYCPFHHQIFNNVIKRMILYNCSTQRSFATIKANGSAFFNVKEYQDEVFLLEDITHQCGHVVFYYILWDKQAYFKCDLNTPLRNFTKNSFDERSILSAFYSLLPFSLSNLCSKICFEQNVFEGDQGFEFVGRYSFRMKKFLEDIRNFDNPEIFTDKGWELYQIFKKVALSIYDEDKDLIERYNTENQDYEFSVHRFQEANEYKF